MSSESKSININVNRVLFGGLVAGLGMAAVNYIINDILLLEHYSWYSNAPPEGGGMAFLDEPRIHLLIPVVVNILAGVVIATIYAWSRKQLGPGPRAAILVGLFIGLMQISPALYIMAHANFGIGIPLGWMASGVLQSVFGALIAGGLYRE